MSFLNKTFALAFAGLIVSATGAFAQAGGPDVPTGAKAQGAKENGKSSTGTDKAGKTDGAPTESGAKVEKKDDAK